MKKLAIAGIVCLTSAISGCAVESKDAAAERQNEHMQITNACLGSNEELSKRLSELTDEIKTLRKNVASADKKILAGQATLGKKISESSAKNMQAKSENKKEEKEVIYSTDDKQASNKYEGKSVAGETEWGYIPEIDAALMARIDTGATTSGISAINIQLIERDGKKIVRFDVPEMDGTLHTMEAPFVRVAEILQSTMKSREDVNNRYIVALTIKIGDVSKKSEVGLSDRTHMAHPLLIGRDFLKDDMIVDVSSKMNFQKPKAKTYIKYKALKPSN